MKHLLHKLNSLRLLTLLTLLLGVGGSQVWAETTTTTYTFTSKSWAAGGSTADWTSGKDGYGLTTDRGIQVTSDASGANATSPVSFSNVTKVDVTYSTNAKNGAGEIGIKIGSNTILNKAVTKTGGTTDRTLEYSFSPAQSGNVQITVKCTTNSIYVKSVAITYQKNPVTGVSLNKPSTTLEVGDVETLTATIAPENADNKNVTWSSDKEGVATVDGNGRISAVAAGTANITFTTEDGSKTATCEVTVKAATKTAVNITVFSADSETLVKGNTTTTTVANDQPGWTAAYNYSSSNPDVATVDVNGVITAVAKGTATITCSLNVDAEDEVYKAGTTSSKTIDITVTNPFHTVTFSSNGRTYSSSSVEEGESIKLPAENPKEVNGYTFRGWKAGTIDGTTDEEPTYVTSPVMGEADVTYYAVFAEAEVSYLESQIEKTQTLQYDTWTYVGTTTDKTDYHYRLFHSGSYIQSAAFDLSLLKKVIVYGGTFGGASYNSLTIGDGSNVWKEVTVSGNSETGTNTYTGGTALSGTKALRITCNSGSASGSGVRISKVEIYTKKKTTAYAHYCTTVSALPRPIITMKDVEMTWGDTDKSVAPSATVNDVAYDGDFTYTVDKTGLTVGADGKLTSNTPGTYAVTANIAATAEHQAASTTCTVTVGKQNVTLSFAETIVHKKTSDASYTQTATATPTEYDGTIAYSKDEESTSENAAVNSSSAAVTFSATGSVIVKATAPATDYYNSAEATYTILIQTDPTIVVKDANIAYGKTFTVDGIEGGNITVTSSNPAVASVAGLVITSHAVGTTTITVATAESDTYVAGEETFTLTVTAPTGESEKPSAEPVVVFYESFDQCKATGGNDGNWSGISGTTDDPTTDNKNWTWNKPAKASECARFGTGSALGSATTPELALENGIEYTLTFKAGAWNGSNENTTLNLSATKATLDKESVSMTKGTWNTYTVTVSNASSEATITFAGEKASNSRFFLDEVKITKPGTPITSTSVTTTGGLATYCYQYPLDLDGISGAKAYVVKDVDMEKGKVMLTQITGTIKGGVPFILKADGDDATFEIPLADESTTVPAGNPLVGTLAPTFVAQTSGDYTNFAYSKSNKCFVKLGDAGNTVPANRAYLPINLGGAGVKSFALTFDNADGIARTQIEGGEERVYNLAGQRLQKAQRGVNIINGRKVLVK